MKPIASDPMVKQGLALAVRKALDSKDPVTALEDNIERVAEAIVSGRAAQGGPEFWESAFAADSAPNCNCNAESTAANLDLTPEDIVDLDEAAFAKATEGKSWEKLMRGEKWQRRQLNEQ